MPPPFLPQELELAAYLVHCERRLAEEFNRCEAYLGFALRKPLKDILDQCLLEAHMSSILDSSMRLLASCQEQDLGRLYRLVGNVMTEATSERSGSRPFLCVLPTH